MIIAAIPLIVYVGLMMFLYLKQRSMIYFPQPIFDEIHEQTIELTNDGHSLKGWVIHPDKAKALVYFGGNAEQIETNAAQFKLLFPNYAIYLIPYRGYSVNPGIPTQEHLFADSLKIYDQLAANHSQISLIGRSLGSGVALYLASQRPIEQLVLITPFDSILHIAQKQFWMFPLSLLLKDPFNSRIYAKTVTCKSLILIAQNDQIIPRWSSDQLSQYFKQATPRIVVIPDAGHNDIGQNYLYQNTLKSFLNQ